MKIFKRLLPMILIFIFEIAIGVLLIIDGEKFTQAVFIIFGVIMLICGLITLIRALLDGRNGGSVSGLKLVAAIVLLAIGAFFTAASASVMSVVSAVTIVIGIIMMFSGMLKLAEYAAMRKEGANAVFAIIGAIVTIILGIVIAFNPFGATEAIWVIIGSLIIVSAVFSIVSVIYFANALKNTKVTVVEVSAKDADDNN